MKQRTCRKYTKDQRGIKRIKTTLPDISSHEQSYAGVAMKGKRYENKRGDDSNFSSLDTSEVTMLNQVKLLQETQKKNEEK
jgi:hypothetical protein